MSAYEERVNWSNASAVSVYEKLPVFSAHEKLLNLWAQAALRHAVADPIEDSEGYFAGVAGVPGAWGFGNSPAEAKSDLLSVLVDWADLKIKRGYGDDIPSMGGVDPAVGR